MPATDYDANHPTTATGAERKAAVGKRASLTLTGVIVGACDSEAGGFVWFEVDERWGLNARFGMDLECFTILEDN